MSHRRTLARLMILTALVGGPALAHARLIQALPRVGSTVRTSPPEIRLFFSETIEPRRSAVTLTGPAGPVPTGPITLDAKDTRVVHVPVGAHLSPARYRVDWSVTSMDTHHTDGDFTFTVTP